MIRFVRRAVDRGAALRFRRTDRYLPECIFGIGFVFYILIFYPGFMSNDSANQILQARSGNYTDWHPPVMTLIWSLTDTIYSGPRGMLVLQSALIWFGAYLTFLAYFGGRRGIVFALALAILLFVPPVFGIAGAIWKDNLMWGLLFVAVGFAGHIEQFQKNNITRPLVFIFLAISLLFLGAAVRTNGIFATVAILALVIYRAYPEFWRYRIPVSLVAGVCVAGLILVSSIAINSALADRRDNSWVSLAVFDIAGMIERSDDDTFRENLFEGIPISIRMKSSLENLLAAYTPRYWRQLFQARGGPLSMVLGGGFSQLSQADLATLRSTWFSGVSERPTAWLMHRWAVFEHVLGLSPDRLWSFSMMKTNGFSERYKSQYGTNPAPSWLALRIERRLQQSSDYWFFRPWFYFIILIGILLGSLAVRKYADINIFFIALSGVMHESALFFLAPSVDYRYSHYMVFTCLLAVLLVKKRFRRNSNKPLSS